MRNLRKVWAMLLSVMMILTLISVPGTAKAEVTEDLTGSVVILHSNDVHGTIDGYAYMAGLAQDYEARGAEVILVDAGDYSQGTTYVSTTQGADAVAMMNAAGYDYAALGNHEFDYGYETLTANMETADFMPLCANILKDEAPIFDPYDVYVTEDGTKIGFFAVDTPEAQTKVNPALIKGLDFLTGEDLWTVMQGVVDTLKDEEGVDLVICLAHLGVDDSSAPYESYDLAKNVTGIDFIIDGHSHSVMTEGKDGQKIQSTGTGFANIGTVTIKDKAITGNELIALKDADGNYLEDLTADAAVAAAAQEIIDRVKAEYGEVFAKSEVTLNGAKAPNGNRDSETNNGDLITDAMLWYATKDEGSIDVAPENVVAITNGGGIRAAIEPGDVTKQDINTVLPFGNTVAVVYVTGAELLEALEASTYCTPESLGGFPQIAGMNINIDISAAYDAQDTTYPGSTYYGPKTINRVEILDVNGKEFDPEAKYAVVTNNFCAAGGDTYYAFAAATSQFDTGVPMDEAVMAYVKEELDGVIGSKYAKPQGRISMEPDMTDSVVILHSNDVHGTIDGYAYIAGLAEQYENWGAEVILADAGDYSQGTTYVSTSQGADAITMMNAAGYDFVGLGNHEFDYGYETLMKNLEKASFAPVCANIVTEDGDQIVDPYAVYETANGTRIAFVGIDTPEAQTKVNPALIKGLVFPTGDDLWTVVQAVVDNIRETENVDLVIALAHLGVDDSSAPYESYDLAENVEGIDFIIDAHSHTIMTEGENGQKIQSTGTAFANVGMIVIKDGKIAENKLIPLKDADGNYLEGLPVDADVAAQAQGIIDRVNEEYGEVFAKSEVTLNGAKAPNGNRDSETNNGDLITDAMLWYVTKDEGSVDVAPENVVAITNGGGIRAAIEPGDVTKQDINTVLPFGNTVAVVYVTGAELLEALEASTYCTPDSVGGFPQIAGMNIAIDTTAAYDAQDTTYPGSTYYGPKTINRVQILDVNSEAFDPEAKYAVVTNNFCAAGGDTYYAFAAATSQFDTGVPMDEAVMAYVKEELDGVIGSRYAAPQGRINVKKPAEVIPDDATAFVNRLYEIVLERKGEEEGVKGWVALLEKKELTGAEAAYGFFMSSEYQNKELTDEAFIDDLYQAILGREADEEGKAIWLKAMESGMGREGILAGFTNSPEFAALCAKYGIEAGILVPAEVTDQNALIDMFVARLYRICLGRKYDEEGLKGWVSMLLSGELTGEQVAYGFFMSPEYQNKKTDDEQYVADLYAAMFDREPEAAGEAGWLEILAEGTAREDVLAGFTRSVEFQNLCTLFGVKAF